LLLRLEGSCRVREKRVGIGVPESSIRHGNG
jgi:hypothetical protein